MQVMEQNPKLAKQSRVLKVSMDAIYDFAITPQKEKNAAGVVFRFMPDAKEVQSALQVSADTCHEFVQHVEPTQCCMLTIACRVKLCCCGCTDV